MPALPLRSFVAWSMISRSLRSGSGLLTAATQVQRLQIPLCATSRVGFFGLVSGMVAYLQCPSGIYTSIAQQNAYTYSLTGMFKGFEMVECSSFQPGYVRCSWHAQRLQDF